MKVRRKKSSAPGTAAKKPAVSRKRSAVTVTKRTSAASAKRSPSATALTADCTIEHAPSMHKRLAKLLADRACVTLDFTEVKRCDTAGLQVLVAFIRERREAGRKVEMKGVSDNFLATAKIIGLSALFGPVMDDGSQARVGRA
jgi:ABC-type transporter Mla MlaB component